MEFITQVYIWIFQHSQFFTRTRTVLYSHNQHTIMYSYYQHKHSSVLAQSTHIQFRTRTINTHSSVLAQTTRTCNPRSSPAILHNCKQLWRPTIAIKPIYGDKAVANSIRLCDGSFLMFETRNYERAGPKKFKYRSSVSSGPFACGISIIWCSAGERRRRPQELTHTYKYVPVTERDSISVLGAYNFNSNISSYRVIWYVNRYVSPVSRSYWI